MNTHISNPTIKDKQGAAKNSTQLALVGIIISFNNSFKPSANAWRIPQNPVTFGPLRRWIDASNFRSAIVKNAIESKQEIIVIKDTTI